MLSSLVYSLSAFSTGIFPSSAWSSAIPSGRISSGIVPTVVSRSSIFPFGAYLSGVVPRGYPISSSSGFYRNISSNRTTLDPAQSASYLSFRKQAACTSSLSSFLAQDTTSSLNSHYDITSLDGSVYLAHSSYTVFYQTTTANKTIFTTTLGLDGSYCNTCDIDYPRADILYWPAQTTNTWCLQFGATIPPPVTVGSVEGSILPAVLPDPTGIPIYSDFARKNRKPKRASTSTTSVAPHLHRKYHTIARCTHLPEGESYAVRADGFKFVSPSVYVIFPVISATNDCG